MDLDRPFCEGKLRGVSSAIGEPLGTRTVHALQLIEADVLVHECSEITYSDFLPVEGFRLPNLLNESVHVVHELWTDI